MTDRIRVVQPEGGRLMTKQSMAMESDINQIVARHVAHGTPFFQSGNATYGDFSGALDYHGSLNAVLRAQSEFERLPAAIREHCRNDPGEFLDLVYDPARREELVKLGLVESAIPAGAPAPAPDPEAAAAGSPPPPGPV